MDYFLVLVVVVSGNSGSSTASVAKLSNSS